MDALNCMTEPLLNLRCQQETIVWFFCFFSCFFFTWPFFLSSETKKNDTEETFIIKNEQLKNKII